MNELIVKVCADRRAWLFVAAGTLLAGLLFVMPSVDQYNALRGEDAELEQQLATSSHTAEVVKLYETQLAALSGQLNNLRDQTLREEVTADFRNNLVKLVRDSGCQLRRLNVSGAQARPWHVGDHPITPPEKPGDPTPFMLETRVVSLSLNGSLARVEELLEKVQTTQQFVYAKTINVQPESRNPKQVDLNIELWFFALQRQDAA